MDEESIYDSLQDFNLGDRVQKLEEEKKQLSELVFSLQEDIEKLCAKVVKMKQVEDALATNISELYKTAKAEIDRKDRIISELRRELDDYAFRRTKHFRSKHDLTERGDAKLLSMPCEQKLPEKDLRFNADHCNERVGSKHADNELLSLVSRQEKNEKISVNVNCDVNIKSHEKDYYPVLDDIDPYIPDTRRYRMGRKRHREEQADDDVGEQSMKKVKYSEYTRRYYRHKGNHRSASREREKTDNSKYNEGRQYSEERKWSEDKRYNDYKERRYKDDRRKSMENDKYDDWRYSDDHKYSSKWHPDDRRRDRRRSTENKKKIERPERKTLSAVVTEISAHHERQSKNEPDRTQNRHKEKEKTQLAEPIDKEEMLVCTDKGEKLVLTDKGKTEEVVDNIDTGTKEEASRNGMIKDLIEREKKAVLTSDSSIKSKSSKSKEIKKDKTKHPTKDKENKSSKLAKVELKESKTNFEQTTTEPLFSQIVDHLNENSEEVISKDLKVAAEGSAEIKESSNTPALLYSESQKNSVNHVEPSIKKKVDGPSEYLERLSYLFETPEKRTEQPSQIDSEKVYEILEFPQLVNKPSEKKIEKYSYAETVGNTVASPNTDSEGSKTQSKDECLEASNSLASGNLSSNSLQMKRRRRCVIKIE